MFVDFVIKFLKNCYLVTNANQGLKQNTNILRVKPNRWGVKFEEISENLFSPFFVP